MVRTGGLTRGLALTGIILTWFPIAMTVLTSVAGTIRSRHFRLDWLMPAELFPAALLGSGLLLWAAWRLLYKRAWVGGGLGAMLLLLGGGQALAVVSGLASGETEPVGLAWGLVVASLALYVLALLVIAITGIFITRRAFQRKAV